jgi:hypothetical protein
MYSVTQSVGLGFIFEEFIKSNFMKKKQKKKSRVTKKIFSLYSRVNGPGMVGFTGTLNKGPKEETPFIEADSKTVREAG